MKLLEEKKSASPRCYSSSLVLASKNFCHEFETTRIFVPTPYDLLYDGPRIASQNL